jgi:hypothetical protein
MFYFYSTAVAGFYHFSGLRGAVDTARVVLTEINQCREYLRTGRENPSQALSFLRVAAKSYVQAYPFAPYLVDKAFDSVDGAIDAHSEEAALIIENLSDKMAAIVGHQKTATLSAAREIVKVVQAETGRLRQGAWKTVAANPELRESVRVAAQDRVQRAREATENAVRNLYYIAVFTTEVL